MVMKLAHSMPFIIGESIKKRKNELCSRSLDGILPIIESAQTCVTVEAHGFNCVLIKPKVRKIKRRRSTHPFS